MKTPRTVLCSWNELQGFNRDLTGIYVRFTSITKINTRAHRDMKGHSQNENIFLGRIEKISSINNGSIFICKTHVHDKGKHFGFKKAGRLE